ncbi:T9SS type A sorting domain-containing protein [Reichenbachiella agarivorans]|uniref:T9SS type A sorting domain-containing protein n=1 Tax=Reichenbachiella agarivorans TaxID=2979464 RepID=A0ABY6CQR9_9BACT|nr:T9SS type A sorting domain-containing protein [Reichenbachiella agarivorans]UXP32847.1 T9SS type A sorting domain-containing protein [Reichenbachiella agarivorans]
MELKAVIIGLILHATVFVTQGQVADHAVVLASASESSMYVAADAIEVTNQIDVYPNPSTDFIIVKIDNSTLKKVVFQLHSMIGNTVDVKAEEVGKNRYKIDLRTFSSGYYFLIIEDEQSQFKEAYKFLKK